MKQLGWSLSITHLTTFQFSYETKILYSLGCDYINKDLKSERLDYIDLARAFCILLMVMGHVGFGTVFSKWIHSFHMPFFFIVSGLFIRQRTINNFLIVKGKSLILPYLSVGLFHCVLFCLINNKWSLDVFAYLLFNNRGSGIPIAAALWFLPAIFIAELLFLIFLKMKDSFIYLGACSIICFVIGLIIIDRFGNVLPLSINQALIGVFFIFVGYCFQKIDLLNLAINKWSLVLLFLFTSATVFLNDFVNMRTGEFANPLLFVFNAISMTIILLFLFKNIDDYYCKISKNGITMFLRNRFKTIGKNSIIYLCFNQLAIFIILPFFSYFVLPNSYYYFFYFLRQLSILFLCMVELLLIEAIIMKTKFKVFIGR